jgi:sugar/nucleoside kinase (ribokinase family)
MSTPSRVLVVGDVIDDVVARVEMPLRPNTDTPARILRESGGSAANTAVWLAAEGVHVDFVGRVGHFDAQRFEVEFAAAGVTAHLEHDTQLATGTIVIVVEGAIRSMLSDRGANAELDPTRIPLALLESATVVHLTGYSIFHHHTPELMTSFITSAQSTGCRVMVDASSSGFLQDFGVERFVDLIAGADILRCNEDEAAILSGASDVPQAVGILAKRFPVVVATLGSEGALVWEDGTLTHVPAAPIEEMVDPTGAGDSFNAGILAGLASGGSVVQAAHRAAEISAKCVTQLGARP